jgi:hypothetical protein
VQGSSGPTGPTGASFNILGSGTGSIVVTDPNNPNQVYYNDVLRVMDTTNYGATGVNVGVSGSIVPLSNNTYSLGTTGYRWSDLYIGTGSVNIGNVNLSSSTTTPFTGSTGPSLIINSNLLPNTSNFYTLGASGASWRDLFVGPGTINIQGPVGAKNVATIGSDLQGIVYTQYGFASPFLNVGPEIYTDQAVGGWQIIGTGYSGANGFVPTDLYAQVNGQSGPTGPSYSLIFGKYGPTGYTGYTGPQGTFGLNGTNYGDYVYWDSNTSQWSVGDTQVSIGAFAGETNQGNYAVAIGQSAGNDTQGDGAVAIGINAGNSNQGTGAVAIGAEASSAGQQKQYSIAIGPQAGYYGQGESSVAMGYQSGYYGQQSNAVAIGQYAGFTGQSSNTVAIGINAGKFAQGTNSLAMGAAAGETNQGMDAVAFGVGAGNNNQGYYAVALGYYAGNSEQGTGAVAIGYYAGATGQGTNSVAMGYQAGYYSQKDNAVAIGPFAGYTGQSINAVAIGANAGNYGQGIDAIAIGPQAGQNGQQSLAIALGFQAGNNSQGRFAVAVGAKAGQTGQGIDAIAMGKCAGQTEQGTGSIAIGYYAGATGQNAYSIVLNASSRKDVTAGNTGFFVNPIRATASQYALNYNPSTSEITYSLSLTGATGQQGPTGATGPTGQQGPTGTTISITAATFRGYTGPVYPIATATITGGTAYYLDGDNLLVTTRNNQTNLVNVSFQTYESSANGINNLSATIMRSFAGMSGFTAAVPPYYPVLNLANNVLVTGPTGDVRYPPDTGNVISYLNTSLWTISTVPGQGPTPNKYPVNAFTVNMQALDRVTNIPAGPTGVYYAIRVSTDGNQPIYSNIRTSVIQLG